MTYEEIRKELGVSQIRLSEGTTIARHKFQLATQGLGQLDKTETTAALNFLLLFAKEKKREIERIINAINDLKNEQ